MTRTEYIEAIKSAVLSSTVKAVMGMLVEYNGFFALPIINPIIQLIVQWILTAAIRQTELAMFFLYVDLRVNEQGKEFEKAAINNELMQRIGTPKEKADAEKKLIDSFRNLAKFTS